MKTRSRGAALLVAMLIVTLVATIAAALVWGQARAVNTEIAERARSQAAWVLNGALDWAGLILREDARANQRQEIDHLGEVWAVPLAEARLSTFLAAEGGVAQADADGPEAFLAGQIEDAQARYNLANLLRGPKLDPVELRLFAKLCEQVGLGPASASQIATQLLAASQTQDERANAPLRPRFVEQLGWLGLDADSVRRLAPWVSLLPQSAPVNVNTAPREVLLTIAEGLDAAGAERLVQARRNRPFQTLEELKPLLPAGVELSPERASVASQHFIVTGRLRLDARVLTQRSLLRRRGLELDLLWREQRAELLPPPS